MVSEVLHAAGYKTAHVGKWHAGQASNLHVPKGRGFDQARPAPPSFVSFWFLLVLALC